MAHLAYRLLCCQCGRRPLQLLWPLQSKGFLAKTKTTLTIFSENYENKGTSFRKLNIILVADSDILSF